DADLRPPTGRRGVDQRDRRLMPLHDHQGVLGREQRRRRGVGGDRNLAQPIKIVNDLRAVERARRGGGQIGRNLRAGGTERQGEYDNGARSRELHRSDSCSSYVKVFGGGDATVVRSTRSGVFFTSTRTPAEIADSASGFVGVCSHS